MENLHEKLIQLKKCDDYPFHMPGHKRVPLVIDGGEKNFTFYERDITEIDGFDNLHHTESLLRDEQEKAAKLFKSEQSYFLVNGSTSGILSAIMSVCAHSNKPILMCRNAHASAYYAVELAGIQADYVFPEVIKEYQIQGSISVDLLKEQLLRKEYSAVYITSPTYEGILSDVESIARMVHTYHIPLIVDEAHGAHLGLFHDENQFPSGAVQAGADIVIESLHKTLPCMTQTAILHRNGDLIDRDKLEHYLRIFQSSSPSYIMMDSIVSGISYASLHQEMLLSAYFARLDQFYERVASLKHVLVLSQKQFAKMSKKTVFAHDIGKIIIGIRNEDKSNDTYNATEWNSNKMIGFKPCGKMIYDMLRDRYHLQMEMATSGYVLAMTSVMDSQEGFERLEKALFEIDELLPKLLEGQTEQLSDVENFFFLHPEQRCTVQQALRQPVRQEILEQSEGQICGGYVYQYPPDVPILVPGEEIFEGFAQYVYDMRKRGIEIKGIRLNTRTDHLEIPVINQR